LAPTYGASLTATIRYYAEHHPEPVGLLVAGRFQRPDGAVPIWVGTQSTSFVQQFGSFRRYFPQEGLALAGDGADVLGPIARAALGSTGVSSGEVRMRDQADDWIRCDVQAFFNQRCLFVFATPQRRLRRGRRLNVAAG
jgi:hypothetical protein